MRLTDRVEKIKRLPDIGRDTFVAGLIVLVGVASFALGRLSVLEGDAGQGIAVLDQNGLRKAQILTKSGPQSPQAEGALLGTESGASTQDLAPGTDAVDQTPGAYVGSKSGTSYHLPWCPGAGRIKEENKIWFASKDEAESLGYRPAANCKGI